MSPLVANAELSAGVIRGESVEDALASPVAQIHGDFCPSLAKEHWHAGATYIGRWARFQNQLTQQLPQSGRLQLPVEQEAVMSPG